MKQIFFAKTVHVPTYILLQKAEESGYPTLCIKILQHFVTIKKSCIFLQYYIMKDRNFIY